MLFNSFEFLFAFLPATLAGFYLLARVGRRAASGWLALASVVFYGYWDPRYTWLLLASVAANFWCGRQLASVEAPARRRRLLAAGVAGNLLALALFKYADFAVGTANAVLGTAWPQPGIVLPLGISFFTFTQIAFLVDASRGLAREYRPTHYLLFVTWFPHLIAGPVLHHRQLMPQFDRPDVYRWRAERGRRGLALFTIGLAKKVLIADALAPAVGPAFDAAARGEPLGIAAAWAGALAYTFQLYFDFSGYSDMAIGLSWLFGVDLPANFNSPYKAANVAEFWRRWHMTLSAFLRDYLYVPLGGNRRGPARRYLNLIITMVLGGLWHGANWTFVVWGAFHGALLAAYHGWRARVAPRPGGGAGRRLVSTAVTFGLVVVGWVVFRADSVGAAGRLLAAMAGAGGGDATPPPAVAVLVGLAAATAMALPNSLEWLTLVERSLTATGWRGRVARAAAGPLGGVVAAVVLVGCVTRLTAVSSEFLYFQF